MVNEIQAGGGRGDRHFGVLYRSKRDAKQGLSNTFKDLGSPEEMILGVQEMARIKPTEVQKKVSIAADGRGRPNRVCATGRGTGKTAFMTHS